VREDPSPVNMEKERRARNEALFREVNERVQELTGDDGSVLAGFVCECSRQGCTHLLQVTHAQYEAVRENPKRFLVLLGHEDAKVDRVVERHDGYLVVEKFGVASDLVIEEDPRS
jgi:hypothetical protein